MCRGELNAIVMMFKNYETNLMEMLNYRRQTNRAYLEWELGIVWKGLIGNYKQLTQLNIVHRDIRLAKVFFNPNSSTQPFQLVNLESARKLVKQAEAEEELMTVRGVDEASSEPVKKFIQDGVSVGLYNAYRYDLDCLIQVLLAIKALDPWQSQLRGSTDEVILELQKRHPDLQWA